MAAIRPPRPVSTDDPEYLDYPDPAGTSVPPPAPPENIITPRGSSNPVPGGLEAEYRGQVDWENPTQPREGMRDSADLGAAAMIDRDSASWEAYLKNSAQEKGVPYDPSDLEGVKRNVSYARNAGVDPLVWLRNADENYRRGATNIPGGNEGSNDYAGPTRLRGGGVNGAYDPFGDSITGGIMDLIKNKGDINGGARTQQRLEGLTELMGRARKSQQNNLQGTLLSRNLMSEPGIPQGMEAGGYGNIEERLAPAYASSLRDILSDESATQNANYLAALGLGNTRQSTLSDIALQTLDRNMEWNRFLAEFGLDRDQTLEALASGSDNQLTQLLNMYLNATGQSASGRT